MKRSCILTYIAASIAVIWMMNLFWGRILNMRGVEMCIIDSMNQISNLFVYPFTLGLLFTYMATNILKINESSSWAIRYKGRKSLFGSQILKTACMAFCCSLGTFVLIIFIGKIQGMEFSNWTQTASFYYLKYEEVAKPLSKGLISAYFILSSTCFFLMSEMIILLFDWWNKNLIYGWIFVALLWIFDWWFGNPDFSGIFFGRYSFQDGRILSFGTAALHFIYPLMLILVLFLSGRVIASKKDFI